MSKKIVYVKHPVTPELKKQIQSEGFKIVDARFAEKGDEIYGQKKPAKKSTNKGKKS